jgi:hypothetical protein
MLNQFNEFTGLIPQQCDSLPEENKYLTHTHMKKYVLILALLFVCSASVLRAQTYISGFSSYIDENGEWTEWIEENVEITIDKKGNLITIFDPLWLMDTVYKITSVEKPEPDEDDDLVTVYHCRDAKDVTWTVTVIDLVTTDPGKLQINFSNDEESTSYHVMEAEKEQMPAL